MSPRRSGRYFSRQSRRQRNPRFRRTPWFHRHRWVRRPPWLRRLMEKSRSFFRDLQIINRNKATELLEFEALELENIFTLLLFGSFTGMPAPPAHITLQLLPLMKDELKLMYHRIGVAHDGLAEVVSVLGEP